MTQLPRLSNREWDVLQLLLQGKNNKQIASSLDISVRTVEFHLKNIYAKFQVRTKVELILNLGSATGGFSTEKLVHTTVDSDKEVSENGAKANSRMGWPPSFRAIISMINKELTMKQFSLTNIVVAFVLIVLGVAIAAAGIYIGEIDDAPGAALMGILLMVGAVTLGLRTAWRKA